MDNIEHNYLDESAIKIGDSIIVGEYCSDSEGCPMIKWSEMIVEDLPLPHSVIYVKLNNTK